LNLNKKGAVVVQDKAGTTNIKGVFAAGDVVTGPLSVIEAMASGRRVAEAIHRHLRQLPEQTYSDYIGLRPLDDKVADLVQKTGRHGTRSLPVEKSVATFDEIDLGYDTEQAVREAQRCLNCGAGATVSDACASCLNCVRICPYGIPVPGKDRVAIDISQCQACGICASECPASAIDLKIDVRADERKAISRIMELARQETPEILIFGFYCRYAAPLGPPADDGNIYWLGKFCTGRLDTAQILYPFELGSDGVIVHSCKDAACRFRAGDGNLKRHVQSARKLLRETGVGPDRLNILYNEEDTSGIREKLQSLGVNPLREGRKK
jgi:coenzyme F420-reducing hydrogenase delta subunit/NAD-dependent dihydropyrimidine dehydrogenase PreA subunit